MILQEIKDRIKNWALIAMSIIIMLLLGTLVVLHYHSTKVEKENVVAVSSAKAADTWHKGSVKNAQAKKEARNATDEVLAANPEWADMPVPDDIADRLRDRSGSKP